MLALQALPAFAARVVIRGTVSYSGGLYLPPRTKLTVRLLDVTLGPEPTDVIVETKWPAGSLNPIPYSITVDTAQLDETRRYALDARVSVDDREILSSPYPWSFRGREGDRMDLMVQTDLTVEPTPRAFSAPFGHWLAEDIGGQGVNDLLPSILIIHLNGDMIGKTGCNTIRGGAIIRGASLKFGGMSMTAKICDGAVSDQEYQFAGALRQTFQFLRLPEEKKLLLLDYNWKPLMRLSEM